MVIFTMFFQNALKCINLRLVWYIVENIIRYRLCALLLYLIVELSSCSQIEQNHDLRVKNSKLTWLIFLESSIWLHPNVFSELVRIERYKRVEIYWLGAKISVELCIIGWWPSVWWGPPPQSVQFLHWWINFVRFAEFDEIFFFFLFVIKLKFL